jgi:hypothetical protein
VLLLQPKRSCRQQQLKEDSQAHVAHDNGTRNQQTERCETITSLWLMAMVRSKSAVARTFFMAVELE